MRYLFILLLVVAPLWLWAQNQDTLPPAGLTPQSSFYFLDRLGEALREFFTFSTQGKARLQITFAAERIAEIKVMLETKGVEAPGLEIAESRLQANLATAAAILGRERAKGKNVSQLAKELDDEFEGPKSAFEEAFKKRKQALENQEDELKAKIKDAKRAGNTAQVEALVKQLAEVKVQKEFLEQEEEELEEALEREEKRLEEEMEARAKAEKEIREAEEEKEEVLAEAAQEGVVVPSEAFGAFDHHLAEAKEALAAGKFEEAKHHAEEAEESLDEVEEAIEDLEEAKEREKDLREEGEEREAQRIREEREKAAEALRSAEKRLRDAGKIEEEDD